jgi:hypothetical protein
MDDMGGKVWQTTTDKKCRKEGPRQEFWYSRSSQATKSLAIMMKVVNQVQLAVKVRMKHPPAMTYLE